MNYEEFIQSKRHSSINHGIEPVYIPSTLFDYQSQVSEYAIKKGRCAGLIDTGLGKTIIELVVATNYVKATNKRVLILTPLSVAFQFVDEAEKFGIDDVSYSKDGKLHSKIIVTNYERLHYFDSNDFDTVILDESSILKNFKGAIKSRITSFIKRVKYRFLFTATPSPNDYIELGTSSEALGYMGYTDMLGRFFRNNNNSIDARYAGEKWYLKPHAVNDFWAWVASWSISMRKPSDLGCSDEKHILPKLKEVKTIVENKNTLFINGQGSLFNLPAKSFHEIKAQVRGTIKERCEAAVSKAQPHDTTVYWVNLNDEAKLIREIDSNAFEIKGSMSMDKKEEMLIAFSKGEIKKLVTKTSITAFGLNWQHCNHTTYFPTYSYEQYYQAIRRFWRFGQKREVLVDLILSDGQSKVMDSLMAKRDKANEMFEMLINNTRSYTKVDNQELKKITLPNFI